MKTKKKIKIVYLIILIRLSVYMITPEQLKVPVKGDFLFFVKI